MAGLASRKSWKQTASTPSRMPSTTSPPARPSCGGIFDYDAKKARLIEVARALEDAGVWNDAKKAQELGKERSSLEATVDTVEKIDASLKDSGELFALAKAEGDDDTLLAVSSDVEEVRKLVESLEFSRMFSDPMDPNNCFIDLNAGQGGTEAQDWVAMLLRMYLKYCDKKGFRTELLEESPGEVAGLKSASVKVIGQYAYGHFRTENGIHRLVRKSPFDSNARRHTSFASVFCYPEVDESIEIEMDQEGGAIQVRASVPQSEGWQLQTDGAMNPDGYQYRVLAGNGSGFYIEPGTGQFGDGGRGDNAYTYVTQYHGDQDEGESDMITIGPCCNEGYQQGPDRFVNGEPIESAQLVLWYVPQMENDDTPGQEYCWARSAIQNGVYVAAEYPCYAGPLFVPFNSP